MLEVSSVHQFTATQAQYDEQNNNNNQFTKAAARASLKCCRIKSLYLLKHSILKANLLLCQWFRYSMNCILPFVSKSSVPQSQELVSKQVPESTFRSEQE